MSFPQKIKLIIYNIVYNFLEFVFFFTHYWWWKFIVMRAVIYYKDSSTKIYNMEKDHLKDLNKDNFIYGETGVLTTKLLLQEINIQKGSTIIDLGCGRGTFLFAANFLFDLKGVGIEIINRYVEYGKKLKKSMKAAGINFFNDNILNADLSSADIVYIAGTTFQKEIIDEIHQKFQELRTGAVVISVHHKIESEDFILFNEGNFPFSWGTDSVYYYRKK